MKKNNYYKDLLNYLLHSPSFMIPFITLLIIFIIGLLMNSFIDPNVYLTLNLEKADIHPCLEYPFGTNIFGQNLFYIVFISAYNTIVLALIATLISFGIGTFLGFIFGHFSKSNHLFFFLKNIIDNVPLIFLYTLVFLSFGNNTFSFILSLVLFSWINIAFLVRNNVMTFKNKDYNIVSKLNKTPKIKIFFNNYLPEVLPLLLSNFAISIPNIITIEIVLYYLGFSFTDSGVSLGHLLQFSLLKNDLYSHFYQFIIALSFLLIINLCFFFIGKSINKFSIKDKEESL